eukprot:7473748-Pyramimonas_sp.AAC.1
MRRHQSLVDNTLKTWHRTNTAFGNVPTPADQDFALRSVQARVYQARYGEGSKWMLPDSAAGTPAGANAGAPAGANGTAEKFDIFTSS